jgi:hypothetical protein
MSSRIKATLATKVTGAETNLVEDMVRQAGTIRTAAAIKVVQED